MSDRTSHRRRARQNRTKQARAGIVVDRGPIRPIDHTLEWDRAGMGPCEKCHTVEAETRFGDLLVCGTCRASFPVLQPWRVCPESGEYLDTKTGKPFVYPDEGLDGDADECVVIPISRARRARGI
jgi:hypothetical protein